MRIQKIDNIGIAVSDLESAASFFSERLGLTVEVNEGDTPPSAVVSLDGPYLYVFESSGPKGDPAGTSELDARPLGIDHVSFTVDDVDAEYERLKAAGVEFVGEPETLASWGLRLVGFEGPDGISFYLVQAIG